MVSSLSSGQRNGGPGDRPDQGQGPGAGPGQEQERGPGPSGGHVPGGRAQEGRVLRHGRQVLIQPGELHAPLQLGVALHCHDFEDETMRPTEHTCRLPSSPTVANTDAFIWSKNQQSFSSQLAAELS